MHSAVVKLSSPQLSNIRVINKINLDSFGKRRKLFKIVGRKRLAVTNDNEKEKNEIVFSVVKCQKIN